MYVLLLLVLLLPSAYGQVEIDCPALSKENYPALLYRKDFYLGQHVNLAYWKQDHFEVKTIFKGDYITSFPIGQQKYLFSSGGFKKPYHTFVIDFNTGKSTPINYDKDLRLLYLEPEQYVMLHYRIPRKKDFSIYRLDYDTLEITETMHWTDENKPELLDGLIPQFQVSPDHKHIAALHFPEDKRSDYSYPPEFTLSVTNLENQTTRFLNAKFTMGISPISSHGRGRPPFTWLSDHEIALFNMAVPYPREIISLSTHTTTATLITADISTPDITMTEQGEYELPLTMGGGTLYMDENQLCYELGLVVDMEAKELVKKKYPYEVVWKPGSDKAEINWELGSDYPLRQYPLHSLITPSHNYLAYTSSSPETKDHKPLYVNIQKRGLEEPFRIDEHSEVGIIYLKWFE